MTIYCPRCGAQSNQAVGECEACAFPLSEVSSIVMEGGKSRFWQRLAITLVLFLALPMVLLQIGEKIDNDLYEFYAGLLLVLLLPGLPWAVMAIFKLAPKIAFKKHQTAKHTNGRNND